jgi:hypothetical protein
MPAKITVFDSDEKPNLESYDTTLELNAITDFRFDLCISLVENAAQANISKMSSFVEHGVVFTTLVRAMLTSFQ